MKLMRRAITHHKTLLQALFGLVLLIANPINSFAVGYEELTVDLYTLTGEFVDIYNPATGKSEPDPNNPVIKETAGTLFVKDGFIPTNTRTLNAKGLGISLATANAINGKYVISLNTWVTLDKVYPGNSLRNYSRSTGTYDFKDVPHVTVAVKGSPDNGQNNTPGNVCTSTVTTITEGNPVVGISALQPNASEAGAINGRFQIDFDAPRARKIVVQYIISGTAANGKDYKKIKNSVVIPAGTTSAYVDIAPIDDRKKEGAESVTLTIKASSAYTVSTSNTASVNIADND